ncbi:MAG TPA: glycosyltransferase family 4 protein [Clostridiales bacterium]|nr:glycosyltransferase family 4 protein [Clostridiales bacterium]
MVGIIFLGEILLSPFAKKYMDVLDENNIEYEIIQWDRSGKLKDSKENVHTFCCFRERYTNPAKKIISLLQFRRFALELIEVKKYDKLVVLTTMTGVLLYRLLTKKYKDKYIFDYRDASYERNKLFKNMVKKIARNANFVCISSKGFLEILDNDADYSITHNFKLSDLPLKNTSYTKKVNEKINISYIGVLREIDYLKKLIQVFGNNQKFNFYIHGTGDNEAEFQDYCSKYSNVFYTGRYNEEEKIKYINNADILCYNYPCSFINNNALANKFYDGIIFKRPMYGNRDTFSGRLIEENNLGICLADNEDDIAEKIYAYYIGFDEHIFCENADRVLSGVIREENLYIDRIKKFLTD